MTLEAGDYSIVGMEHLIAIERKSVDDYWGCMGKRRFRDCLKRLAAVRHSCVVVEADSNIVLAELYRHTTPERGGTQRVSCITGRIAMSITREHMAKFKVPFWFAGDRERGQLFTMKFLETSFSLVKAAMRRERNEHKSIEREKEKVVLQAP